MQLFESKSGQNGVSPGRRPAQVCARRDRGYRRHRYYHGRALAVALIELPQPYRILSIP